jgi:hypothetical protein
MRGRQVNFLALPGDIALIEHQIAKTGGVLLTSYPEGPAPQVVETIQRPPYPHYGALATLSGLLGQVHVRYIEPQRHHIVDRTTSPVVEIDQALRADGPSEGRLYFKPQAFVGREWIPFDPTFVEWADSLLSWARRRFTYDREHQIYEGPDALAWRQSSRV